MSEKNKTTLQKANAAISEGDVEGFLSFCTDDIEWTAVGEQTIKGKEAVRQWLATTYGEPPQYTVTDCIAEGDFLTVLGEITLKGKDGQPLLHSYCDVWRFRGEKMAQLRAFVIPTEAS